MKLALPRAAVALAALLLACAQAPVTGTVSRDARLREALDAYKLPKPIAQVWPDAMKLVAARGFELIGKDRAVVGQKIEGGLGKFFAKGFSTRSMPDDSLALETNENGEHVRYRVEGKDAGGGTSRVTYTAIRTASDAPTEYASRDPALELELVKRVDPDGAARIVQAVGP